MKKTIAFVTAVLFLMTAPAAFAYGKSGAKEQGLEEKICSKAQMIAENGEEVGLSAESVQKAKDLKMKAKRVAIQKDAEIALAALDCKEALYQKGALDLGKINALIDAKYALKSDKAKQLAAIYAELKVIPTAEQWKEMKQQKKCSWMKMKPEMSGMKQQG